MALKRQQEILKYLTQQSTYIPVKTIASEFDVSVRTIHNDLNTLIDKASDYEIEKIPNKGIKIRWLQIPVESESITSKDIHELFGYLLFKDTPTSMDELSEKFYRSKTSIALLLERIEKNYLNSLTMQLYRDKRGTYLHGNEIQIQNTLVIFNELIFDNKVHVSAESLASLNTYYDSLIIKACLKALDDLDNHNFYNIPPHYRFNVINKLLVMVYRISKGYHLPIIQDKHSALEMKQFLIAKELLNLITQSLDLEYTDEDTSALAIYLEANRLEFKSSESYDLKPYASLVNTLTTKMSECIGINLGRDPILFNDLVVHVYHMVYRSKNKIEIRNPLLDDIKNDFRLMYDLTWMILNDMKDDLDLSVTEDEVGFLMLHLQSAVDRLLNHKRLLVICENGVVSSNFIVNRLKRIVPPLDVIETLSYQALETYDLQDVDLIISTIPIPEQIKPSIIVSPLLSDKDLLMVNDTYQKHFYAQTKTPSYEILNKYLHEVIIVDEMMTQSDAIDLMSVSLIEEGYVEPKFVDSIKKREMKGGTELESGAAVPHGSIELVNKTKVNILINKTPIKWGRFNVKIVIMIAIAKDDLKDAKKLLENILKLVGQVKDVERISRLKSKEAFIMKLKEDMDFDK